MVTDFKIKTLPRFLLRFVTPSLSTQQFRSYSMKVGRDGKPLPIILCDTMGLEESTGAGLDIDDIVSILKGHLPDRYQVQNFVIWTLHYIDLSVVNSNISV